MENGMPSLTLLSTFTSISRKNAAGLDRADKVALFADAEAAGELDARVEVGRFLFGSLGDEELGVGNISGNGGCRSEQ